jgi:putative transcriptional regulator
MSTLGKRLIKAAKEARTIARGEARPKTFRVHTPSDIDVPAIRKRLGLSQNEFSARFGIPPGTLRDWEQNRRRPEGPARALLIVIDKEPEAVKRALKPLLQPA